MVTLHTHGLTAGHVRKARAQMTALCQRQRARHTWAACSSPLPLTASLDSLSPYKTAPDAIKHKRATPAAHAARATRRGRGRFTAGSAHCETVTKVQSRKCASRERGHLSPRGTHRARSRASLLRGRQCGRPLDTTTGTRGTRGATAFGGLRGHWGPDVSALPPPGGTTALYAAPPGRYAAHG